MCNNLDIAVSELFEMRVEKIYANEANAVIRDREVRAEMNIVIAAILNCAEHGHTNMTYQINDPDILEYLEEKLDITSLWYNSWYKISWENDENIRELMYASMDNKVDEILEDIWALIRKAIDENKHDIRYSITLCNRYSSDIYRMIQEDLEKHGYSIKFAAYDLNTGYCKNCFDSSSKSRDIRMSISW